jgi:hypothetical protein
LSSGVERRARTREILQSLVESARPLATPTTNDPFLKFVPKKVSRDSDGVITGCDYSEEYFEKPSMGLAVMLVNQYCDSAAFAQSLAEVSGLHGKPADSFQKPVRKFLWMSVLGEKPDIEVLLDDLEGKPCTWYVTAQLVGVVPESKMFLSEDVILRKVDEADLIYEAPTGVRLMIPPPIQPFPDSVLQAMIVSHERTSVQRRVETILRLLSLYRETGAGWSSLLIRTSSFSRFGGGTQTLLVPLAREPRAILKQEDAEGLASFVRDFADRLPSGLLDDKLVSPLDVSMKRYLDSTRGNLPIAERLTSTVMGLEALLLENQGEARFRLAIRSANLLRLLNEDPASVYGDLLVAYDYRSAHVHGSVLSDEKQIRAGKLLGSVWRYLRKVLLLMIAQQVDSKAKKGVFLKEVDLALVEEKIRKDLESMIQLAKQSMMGAV